MSRAEFEEWMRKHEPSIPLDYGKDGPWYDWQDAGSYFALAKAATEAAAEIIDNNTSPTGGWLESPKKVVAMIRGESR